MTILVTGGSGSIGAHTALALADLGEEVLVTRHRRAAPPSFLEGRVAVEQADLAVYYAATELEARACIGRSAVVVGGANSAGQAALFLAQHAGEVHVLIRRGDLTETMSSYLAQRLAYHDRITVHPRSQLTAVEGDGRLTALTWRDEQRDVRLEAGGLFLMIGAVPRTAWLRDAGVELDSSGFVTTRGTFATSVDGLFAVGDVRAGSVKRVASAVGEGSVVVSAVHAHLGARVRSRAG